MAVAPGGFIGPRAPGGSTAALTVAELRAAIGAVKDTDERLAALLEAASAMVERTAAGAPEAAKREATIRLAAWIRSSPPTELYALSAGGVDVAFRPLASRNALRSSGAAGLLAPWRRPRGLVVG